MLRAETMGREIVHAATVHRMRISRVMVLFHVVVAM
jgi:hypothetical protein